MTGLRLVIGADEAGYDYKQILKKDLLSNPLVESVTDVGVEADGRTPYPSVAITAAEQIAAGDADRAILICGTGLGMAIAAKRSRASVLSRRTTASRSSARC